MIISEKQIMLLLSILYDSIRAKIIIGDMFSLSHKDRLALYNEIQVQQSEELKVISNDL